MRTSVIITCYTEGQLLLDAVESIRRQSLSPDEIIIVNDASPDLCTNEICRDLKDSKDITVITRTENGGPSVARNQGFEEAGGEILIPLDADDLLPENAIQSIIETFTKFPDADFIHGSYVRHNSPTHFTIVSARSLSLQKMLSAKRFSVSSNWHLIGTAPLRKSLWEIVGGIDSCLGSSDLHDLEFWIRAMSLPCKHYHTSDVIYTWRKYLGSNSRQVTPLSWYKIAKRHFDTYQSLGLEYRAYELLLLGSKWEGDSLSVKIFRNKLLNLIKQGHWQFSSVAALLIPVSALRLIVKIVGHYR